ncbi:25524_t:CDS:1, partial [Gigaspora margarita]
PKNKDDTYSHTSPPNLNQLEKEFKIAISDSLNKYCYDFCKVGLAAILLDPRTKKMLAFTNRERAKARTKLRNEFDNLQHLNIISNDQPQQTLTLITTEITQNPFFEGIFGVQDQEDTTLDELERYLNITPINYNANS